MLDEKKVYLTVSSLNKYLQRKYVNDPYLKEIYLKGEVSNFKLHSSGILYFTIKDGNSKIDAIKFDYDKNDFKDGDSVLVKGEINFYFPKGEHTFIVYEIKKDNIGELYKKFIKLKNKLENEGLFSIENKKKLKKINNNIGIISSSTGAALQDIKRTIYRRFPMANIKLYSCLVQGNNSSIDIVKKIKEASNDKNDVIIIARGGGSIEDLWSFNEEIVVKEIFNCKIPVVTGIGHENDITLSDYVADIRASTPTAAAEIVTPITLEELIRIIDYKYEQMTSNIIKFFSNKKKCVNNLLNIYKIKTLDNILFNYDVKLNNRKDKLNLVMDTLIYSRKALVDNNKFLLVNKNILSNKKNKLVILNKFLENNYPINILKKGYIIAENIKNEKIISIDNVFIDDNIKLYLSDGEIQVNVKKIIRKRGKDV
ncbi:exodeoxyribonuclease VII large subunit [Gemelliphila asaccharolytica]|uniref:Exodeoxyribonuclease 7 large subunit n=1 Tax=Gemelliphila asaccharolytica TaxID=502393 RepID=A0ABR5TLY9_9BACL|nr:exodeoxyribonuclease VII large subunit [Gemella asaccharolytica]KXB58048.1 exodeoxyribonuclease VII, large subunit [Gemella asaccharolytica]